MRHLRRPTETVARTARNLNDYVLKKSDFEQLNSADATKLQDSQGHARFRGVAGGFDVNVARQRL
ncbi:MAG TPA: hypothetical protein DCR20_12110 [Planctomycetaceae bacterium]|jgi:hypothetical protein|nr:hypothetical protein [Planctomycetaceae bacterium]